MRYLIENSSGRFWSPYQKRFAREEHSISGDALDGELAKAIGIDPSARFVKESKDERRGNS